MRMTIVFTVLTCSLLPGSAEARSPLANIYAFYLKAEDCAAGGMSFDADDIAKLTAAVNQYAEASGVPQKTRDKELDAAKKADDLVVPNQEWCNATRNSLSNAFPGIVSLIDDNPL